MGFLFGEGDLDARGWQEQKRMVFNSLRLIS